MRTSDAWIIRSMQDAGLLQFVSAPNFPYWTATFVSDPRQADLMPRRAAEQLLDMHRQGERAPAGDIWAVHFPGGPDVELVQLCLAPQCGCCGKRGDLRRVGEVAADPREWRWRCPKHVGRNPCLIDPCGVTGDANRFRGEMICGKHWRQGPKRIRDHMRAIERKAKRFGWNDRLAFLHDQAWRRLVAAVREGPRIELAEIERLFGV